MTKNNRFMQLVLDQITHDKLALPSLPEVALQIGDCMKREDVTSAGLAALIARDPSIAARLLRVASSAGSGGKKIESLSQAITRLGLEMTRLLVSGLAVQQLFLARSPTLQERLRKNWKHSVEVAALAQVLALRVPGLKPDMAMLAGLMHQIGVLPLLSLADSRPELLGTPAELEEAITALHPRIGRLILQAWQFPADIVEVPMACASPAANQSTYADVVMVASQSLTTLDQRQPPVFDRLGLSAERNIFDLEGVLPEYSAAVSRLAA